MGNSKQRSIQLSIKFSPSVVDRIKKESELAECTVSDFVNDAVKHYLSEIDNTRIDLAKYNVSIDKLIKEKEQDRRKDDSSHKKVE